MLFESTANDIFRKFDMLLNRELGYSEFKGFCDCVGKHMTEEEFTKDILNKFVNLQQKGGPLKPSDRKVGAESLPSESQTARG